MKTPQIVPRDEWLAQRKALLDKEKEWARLSDRLSAERRELPWVGVPDDYRFEGEAGVQSLGALFDGRSQLLVYHFMFAPSWEQGCPLGSFWADQFNPLGVHLNQRDVKLVAVSNAPIDKLSAFKVRMGWSFSWVSAVESRFSGDFGVTFSREEIEQGQPRYNYRDGASVGEEMPGLSVFYKNSDGEIFHTYSCYARGLEAMNSSYSLLDLVPRGRDEAGLRFPMAWVRYHDRYEQ